MTLPILGGCACGKVRYECSERPLVQLLCHCRDCQHASGGAFAAFVFVPSDRLVYNGAAMRHYDVTTESGRTLRRQFCGECGSPVSARWPDLPRVELLHVASLDNQTVFTPTHELWVSRAEAWHPFHPNTVKVEEGPSDEVVRNPLRTYFSARRS
jgi:hypothetical protein